MHFEHTFSSKVNKQNSLTIKDQLIVSGKRHIFSVYSINLLICFPRGNNLTIDTENGFSHGKKYLLFSLYIDLFLMKIKVCSAIDFSSRLQYNEYR